MQEAASQDVAQAAAKPGMHNKPVALNTASHKLTVFIRRTYPLSMTPAHVALISSA